MLSFSWTDAFEEQPSGGSSRSIIDDTLRQLSRGVRERMEREHNWGSFTEEDDGTHRPGQTGVALRGNTATRAALADMQEGAVYVNNETGEVEIFNGTNWLSFTPTGSISHASLDGLDEHDHTQYWNRHEGLDSTDPLDMNGHFVLGTGSISGGVRVHDHLTTPNPVIDAAAASANEYRYARIVDRQDILDRTLTVGIPSVTLLAGEFAYQEFTVPAGYEIAYIREIYFNPGVNYWEAETLEFGVVTRGATPTTNIAMRNISGGTITATGPMVVFVLREV